MNEEDMQNLARVVLDDPEPNPKLVHDRLLTGQMVPWRAETDKGTSIILMEVKQREKDRVLFVWYLCGKGIYGNGRYILDTIVEYAKLHNCDAVEALTNMRFAKYLCRPEAGFEMRRAFVRKEI